MTSINGYLLSNDLQLSGLVNQPGLLQSITQTLGGRIIQNLASSAKNYILSADLRGDKLYGFFTRADAVYLANLRDTAQIVDFIHPAWSGQVLIPANGIGLEILAADETVQQEATELMHGTIILMVI